MGSGSAQPRSRKFSDTAPSAGMWVSRNANDRTLLANSPDWLKAAPMRENLLASWRQSGQKQDPCPSLLNYNAKYKRLLPPFVISPTVSGRLCYRRLAHLQPRTPDKRIY